MAVTHINGGGTEPCMAATHRVRVALWSISPSAWRATMWLSWEVILCQLWAKLDLGPMSKVEAHKLFYNYHKGCGAIRAID